MRILVACANGFAVSQMMKGKIEQALLELNCEKEVLDEFAIEGGVKVPTGYDVIFCPEGLVKRFRSDNNKDTVIIGMKNILSVNEAKEHLIENGLCNK